MRIPKELRIKPLRELIGIALVIFSWFNPFNFDLTIRIIIFVLGFDTLSVLPKLAIFATDYLFGFAWLGFTLFILVAAEAIVVLLGIKKIRLIIKPAAVFIVSFFSLGFQPALIVTGIDLLLNIGIGK